MIRQGGTYLPPQYKGKTGVVVENKDCEILVRLEQYPNINLSFFELEIQVLPEGGDAPVAQGK